MKKNLGILLVALFGVGCAVNAPDDVKPTLSVEPTVISATALGDADYSIDVTSNSTWTAQVTAGSDWCTIDPATGTGDGSITVVVDENTSGKSRKATISIKVEGAHTVVVTVNQPTPPASTLTLDVPSISAGAEVARYYIGVTSNSEWSAQVTTESDWCTINSDTGIDNGTIAIVVDENTGINPREATITVTTTDRAVTRTVKVRQAATTTIAFLEVDKTEIPATAATATYSIAVTSNRNWTANNNVEWCTLTEEHTTSSINSTLKINVKENTDTKDREATITISTGDIKRTVTVKQLAANATLTLEKLSIEATVAGGSYSVSVTSNSKWKAQVISPASEWCTISPVEGSTGNGSFTVNVKENASTSTRTATIGVVADNVTTNVTVTQAQTAILELDSTSISAGAAMDFFTVSVTSNSGWSAQVTEGSDWCKITALGGIGNGSTTIIVKDNPIMQPRTAIITITAGVIPKTITVTQAAAAATLNVKPASIAAIAAEDVYSLAVISNSDWSAVSSADWCTLTPDISSGIITVRVAENPSTTSDRTATITVTTTDGTLTKEVTVTQRMALTILELDQESFNLSAGASTNDIKVTSNSAWMATVNPATATWCTISPTAGTGTGIITVTVPENLSTAAPLTAVITVAVGSGAHRRTVVVTQAAADATLTIAPDSIVAFPVAKTYDIAVTSNSSWTVTSDDPSWCTISSPLNGTGVGGGIIKVNVIENSTAVSREATLTVTTTNLGTSVTQRVIVTQVADPFKPLMKTVPGGSTTLGLASSSVTLSSFAIGQYEVTQKQWKAVMGSLPATGGPLAIYGLGDNYPMYNVSWGDIQDFLTQLNVMTGKSYRLPTEAEWEYAAKGGSSSLGYTYSGDPVIEKVAWYQTSSGGNTHQVGTLAPNELSIHDMSGNVAEWCSDNFGNPYPSAPNDPQGAVDGPNRVVRGGGWGDTEEACRVIERSSYPPETRNYGIGFRLVLPLL